MLDNATLCRVEPLVRRLRRQTLAEEEATDKALTALGEGGINQAAVAAGADSEEDE
jgi:ferritin-like metal-binding protein YciE